MEPAEGPSWSGRGVWGTQILKCLTLFKTNKHNKCQECGVSKERWNLHLLPDCWADLEDKQITSRWCSAQKTPTRHWASGFVFLPGKTRTSAYLSPPTVALLKSHFYDAMFKSSTNGQEACGKSADKYCCGRLQSHCWINLYSYRLQSWDGPTGAHPWCPVCRPQRWSLLFLSPPQQSGLLCMCDRCSTPSTGLGTHTATIVKWVWCAGRTVRGVRGRVLHS